MTLDNDLLQRIAEALERLAPAPPAQPDLDGAEAFVWRADIGLLEAVASVNRVDIGLLKGIDHQTDQLVENTRRFANGFPANNALLWGARGSGKSSLVKAVHAQVNGDGPGGLLLVEIHREDVDSLPRLLTFLRNTARRTILFCDDLSFDDTADTSYKSLKAVLEGGIEGGFHNCDQETYFAMIAGYVAHYGLKIAEEDWRARAVEWSMTRGARSGRVAWQYIQDLAGRLGQPLE
jgi:predicted AAA+ superfamily ATPase